MRVSFALDAHHRDLLLQLAAAHGRTPQEQARVMLRDRLEAIDATYWQALAARQVGEAREQARPTLAPEMVRR